jgi:putative ABC transport system permease protein
VVYITYTNAIRLNGTSDIMTYYFSAVSGETIDHPQWLIESRLKKTYGDTEDAFMVLNMAEVMSIMESIENVLVTALVGIAGISLLVGGIGIMNICCHRYRTHQRNRHPKIAWR